MTTGLPMPRSAWEGGESRWTDETHPVWQWLLPACAFASALPLWTASHLPFVDLPQHVANIATLRHWTVLRLRAGARILRA